MSTPTPQDPFAALDNQRTFVVPTPGARPPSPTQVRAQSAGADVAADIAAPDHGLNPLVAQANRLLAAIPQIRSTAQLPDPAALKESLAQGIREFEARAKSQGIAPERVMAARYILCTVLDEAAAGTPWGGSGVWGKYSLLAMFHNETWGGEKVFQLMAKLAENPTANRDLLELIYAVLALGFEGRYRVVDGGRAQLDSVRSRLAQILAKERGDHAAALSQHWQGQALRKRPLLSWLPLWVTAMVCATVLIGLYMALSFSLSGRSDPVFSQIQALRLTPPTPPVKQPAPRPRLAQFLEPEIRAGLVAVRDEIDRSVITIRGDGLFAPGGTTLSREREQLMQRIADALKEVPGPVLVTGHTDSVPIRTARFPSNWHLSEERATSVGDVLIGRGLPANRIKTEGRADSEPIASNDTAANRALNRRVEITLMAARAGAGS